MKIGQRSMLSLKETECRIDKILLFFYVCVLIYYWSAMHFNYCQLKSNGEEVLLTQ